MCVLGASAFVRVAALAGGGILSVATLVTLSAPSCVPWKRSVRSERHLAAVALHDHDALLAAVRRAGGALPCRSSVAADGVWQTARITKQHDRRADA